MLGSLMSLTSFCTFFICLMTYFWVVRWLLVHWRWWSFFEWRHCVICWVAILDTRTCWRCYWSWFNWWDCWWFWTIESVFLFMFCVLPVLMIFCWLIPPESKSYAILSKVVIIWFSRYFLLFLNKSQNTYNNSNR